MEADKVQAFVQARLTGSRGRQDWQHLLSGAVQHWLSQPLSALTCPEDWLSAADSVTSDLATRLGSAWVRAFVQPALEAAAEDEVPLADWWGAAQNDWHALVTHPGFVDPAWVQAWFAEDAVKELVSDTLYEALRDFSTLVPRVVEKLLPAGLGKLARLGSKASERVFDEVEKHLEKEMRRWLERGTQTALEGSAKYCIEHLDSPQGHALRKNLVDFAASRSPAIHVQAVDAAFVAKLEATAAHSFAAAAARPKAAELREQAVRRWFERHGSQTLRELLQSYGLEADPPVEQWAQLSWPAVEQAVNAPATQKWLAELCADISAL